MVLLTSPFVVSVCTDSESRVPAKFPGRPSTRTVFTRSLLPGYVLSVSFALVLSKIAREQVVETALRDPPHGRKIRSGNCRLMRHDFEFIGSSYVRLHLSPLPDSTRDRGGRRRGRKEEWKIGRYENFVDARSKAHESYEEGRRLRR